MSRVAVRDARDDDLAAITAIYADGVLTGTGTFELEPPSLADMAARRASVAALGLPWLVAEVDGGVVGYAYAGPFRTRAAYRYTVEDSIYVASAAQGRGVGKALLDALLSACEARGVRQVLAVIGDSANAGSVRLHAGCGFRPMGVIEAVGWKFDAWRDVVFMQKALGQGGEAKPDTAGLAF